METRHLLIFLIFILNENDVSQSRESKKCKLHNVYGLKALDCHDLFLNEFPKGLTSNVQVMDLSTNRIRKISKAQLEKYPYIMHLYLYDNFIQKLDSDTFDPLHYLETLDLSVNGLLTVPSGIFQLPSLKILYLSKNMNINIAESLRDIEPISYSSLTKVDISYITEEGTPAEFPNFIQHSMIASLNITGNYFNHISTTHFAGLCNLQILTNSDVTCNFLSPCDCWNINNWLAERKVNFTAFRCPNKETECSSQFISDEDISVYAKCLEKTQRIKRSTFFKKLGIWIGVALAFLLILAAFFIYRCWIKRRHKKTEHEMKHVQYRTVR
ncbi:leucine-rich repeat transmembrane protein FLRT2-like [Anthonomus grandis grandis]|uniref:leucine-rich repeat transmembrane protein FLRT2-like n=1 Tax=Anthonomus grandis grandis TaxID=2921223 RepID=UPI0021654FF5|nr:leucine-rich repeat transmembrane protein FLRT2-like [Anthonomus grandis grandis]